MQTYIDNEVMTLLGQRLGELEDHLHSDVISFFGPLVEGVDGMFKRHIESLQEGKTTKRLDVILTTRGGSAETVERIVNTLRHHYEEVNFIVPNYAYSAGTVLCMSGDAIYMNYYSVLGPIDPQVVNDDDKLVPALGYLDKVNEMITKCKKGELTDVEFVILESLDLAELRSYEQARDLTVDLLKKWLVKYKFKNWNKHSKTGKAVTQKEKEQRAEHIAEKLGDTSIWHTHARPISLIELQNDLQLKIENYDDDPKLKCKIENYFGVMQDYTEKYHRSISFHTRRSNSWTNQR